MPSISKRLDSLRSSQNLQRIHSKDWALREKGFNNIATQLNGIDNAEGVLDEIAHVLIVGIDDKTSEVRNCEESNATSWEYVNYARTFSGAISFSVNTDAPIAAT